MTCAECMDALLVANLRSGTLETATADAVAAPAPEIEAHAASCEWCARALDIVRGAERGLSASLSGFDTPLIPESIAATAYRRVRRERLIQRTVLPAIALAFVLTVAFLANTLGPQIRAFFTPPPPVETQTFSLNCLSGQQAASLLRPYLPMPQNPMWQAERFDVSPAAAGIRAVTVRAPKSTLARVPGLLAQFERDPRAACRVQQPGP